MRTGVRDERTVVSDGQCNADVTLRDAPLRRKWTVCADRRIWCVAENLAWKSAERFPAHLGTTRTLTLALAQGALQVLNGRPREMLGRKIPGR